MTQGKMMGADLTVVIPSAVEGPLTFASVSEISGAEAPSHRLEVLRLRFAQDDNRVRLRWPHREQPRVPFGQHALKRWAIVRAKKVDQNFVAATSYERRALGAEL